MGTQLEYAINLLATSKNSSILRYMDDQPYRQTRELNKNLEVTRSGKIFCLRDRMPDRNNPDFIKNTMQMHEDIFKQQVRELHRLYRVQRTLMDELKKELKQPREYKNHKTNSDIICARIINRSSSATQTANGFGLNFQSIREDPCWKERTDGETLRVGRGFDLEVAAEEETSTVISCVDDNQAGPSSFPPSKTSKLLSDESDEDSEVELTLSIGGGRGRKKSKTATLCSSINLRVLHPNEQGTAALKQPPCASVLHHSIRNGNDHIGSSKV